MKQLSVMLIFFGVLPFLASAKVFVTPSGLPIEEITGQVPSNWTQLPTPSGFLVWVPIAHAQELNLTDKIKLYISTVADQYDLDKDLMLAVANCESQFNPLAVGDHGKAFGLWQFWSTTFDKFKAEADMPDLEYKNWHDQTDLAGYAFANGHQSAWTCYTKLSQ